MVANWRKSTSHWGTEHLVGIEVFSPTAREQPLALKVDLCPCVLRLFGILET